LLCFLDISNASAAILPRRQYTAKLFVQRRYTTQDHQLNNKTCAVASSFRAQRILCMHLEIVFVEFSISRARCREHASTQQFGYACSRAEASRH